MKAKGMDILKDRDVNVKKKAGFGKRTALTIAACIMAISLAACGADGTAAGEADAAAGDAETVQKQVVTTGEEDTAGTGNTDNTLAQTETVMTTANVSSGGAMDASDFFTDRDLTQTADLSEAEYITLKDGTDVEITEAGVYVISGASSDASIIVNAADDAKVQLVLNGAEMTNDDTPCIYVKSADKVFVTTAEGTVNTLSVTGTFTADGTTNTDAVIFSKDDLVLNGLGTLEIYSSDNGIAGKDDIKITGGTLVIEAVDTAIEANDSIIAADGDLTLTAGNDGLHAENDEDDTVGYIYICGGSFDIDAGDDGIHATTIVQVDGGSITIDAAEGIEGTYVQVNDGDIDISATDDGINAAAKSSAYSIMAEFNGGYVAISMGQGDTDAVDVNGDLYINGGTLDITAQSPFDYDGRAELNGGTLIVNGSETNTITNQMMGGMGGMMGDPGMGGFGGQGGFGGGPGGF